MSNIKLPEFTTNRSLTLSFNIMPNNNSDDKHFIIDRKGTSAYGSYLKLQQLTL